MDKFKTLYETHGLNAMLREVHLYCTARSRESPVPHVHIHNELITYVTKICLRLCRAEPLMVVISDAFNAFEKASQETYPSMATTLVHYNTLLQIYLARVGPVARDYDEYCTANGIIISYVHHTFEACHQPTNMMDLLAEESIRNIQGREPLLNLYHQTWTSILEGVNRQAVSCVK